MLNSSIVEITTAATDIMLAICSLYYVWKLYSQPVNDTLKRKYWMLIFGFLGMATFLGAISHGLNLSNQMIKALWIPIHLCLGLVVGYFVQVAIHEKWGSSISSRTQIFVLIVAFVFLLVTFFTPISYLVFITYQAIGLLVALIIFSTIYIKQKQGHILLVIISILLSYVAAGVQATKSLSFNFIWPFDHNSSFHLIQLVAGYLIYISLKMSLITDNELDHKDK